jgi:stringent starvation protein B
VTPRRPYLLRALLDWILDNQQTPYLLVQVDETVTVPTGFVQDGRIVLNLSPMAIRGLVIGNEAITFDGRFSGQNFLVHIPIQAVLAIYAKESGEGMLFETESAQADSAAETPAPRDSAAPGIETADGAGKAPSRVGGSHLKIVK